VKIRGVPTHSTVPHFLTAIFPSYPVCPIVFLRVFWNETFKVDHIHQHGSWPTQFCVPDGISISSADSYVYLNTYLFIAVSTHQILKNCLLHDQI